MSIVLDLQKAALSEDVSVANLLARAKVIATKLDLKDALLWINNEIEGYPNTKASDLPAYRQIYGEPKAWNPYHGWQPILMRDANSAKWLSYAPLSQAIGAIEKMMHQMKDNSGGAFTFPYPPELKIQVQKAIDYPTDVHIEIGPAQISNILDQVRNLVLKWTLELEGAGVLGSDMSFTKDEKDEAPQASQNFFIQNVGVLGNVSGAAHVTNTQSATLFSTQQIADLLKQIDQTLPALPEEVRAKVGAIAGEITDELKAARPSSPRLRDLLGSLRKVCESATGSVVAQGILHILRGILGA